MQETQVWFLGWEDPQGNGKATHSSLWPGEFHGLYSTWGPKELDTTERFSLSFKCLTNVICYHLCSKSVEGNGNPLQYSCLENSMDRGTWQGTVCGVARVRHDLATKLLLLKFTLEKEMATHYNVSAWRIPWTGEPGGLQSMGSQRVGHDWVTNTHTHVQNQPKHYAFGYGKSKYLCGNEYWKFPTRDQNLNITWVVESEQFTWFHLNLRRRKGYFCNLELWLNCSLSYS